ncbi:MAG: FMN-binding glutamate synthase family protein [Gammaproteobacteria bacterium]
MSNYVNWIVIGFAVILIVAVIAIIFMYIQDVTQQTHTIRRNYPVIGRLRYVFERQGEFFRQYFFAHDRQEQPFNRATRAWVYRTAKGLGGLIGFGSTNDLREPGSHIFISAPFPLLVEEYEKIPSLIIGPDCAKPFEAKNVFNISGMSYGALSKPAVQALSHGAAKAGIWMNTGEGGLSPYHLEGGCDIIFQIGTAKYGVRDLEGNLSDEKLLDVAQHVKAFEIKLSQGAKPGRGGVLPAKKVTEDIAQIRGIPVNKTSSSPNRHKDIGNPEELLKSIHHIRELTGRPVGFKTVIGSTEFPRLLCKEIDKLGVEYAPDFITVDGGEGGTGAAPQLLADHVGLPLSESLIILVDSLIEAGLKERVKVIASGKLITSAKVAWALCMGADFAVSARGFMFSLGCIQSLACNKDSCPTGITTHNKRLQKGLVVSQKSGRVAQYAHWMNHEINLLAHSCGLPHAREFRRKNIRMVQMPGRSFPMDVTYPYPKRP